MEVMMAAGLLEHGPPAAKKSTAAKVFVPVEFLADPVVGKRLRLFREKRGLSQDDLERLSGVSQSTISRIEARPESARVGDFVVICRALRITLGDLVDSPMMRVEPRKSTRRAPAVRRRKR